jgi:hypothetical protein
MPRKKVTRAGRAKGDAAVRAKSQGPVARLATGPGRWHVRFDSLKAFLGLMAVEPGWPSLPRPSLIHVAVAAVLAALICVVYGAIAWGMLSGPSDYTAHVYFAEVLYQKGQIVHPHFLYQAIVAALYSTGLISTFRAAGLIGVLIFYALMALLMYGLLFTAVHEDARLRRAPVLFAVALAVLLAQPLVRTGWYEIGYLWTDCYESPTLVMIKPLAMATLACTAWYLSKRRGVKLSLWALFFITTVAGGLSKPSFLICLVPVATILAIVRIAQRKPLSVGALLAGLCLPAAAVLGWQYYQTFSGYTGFVEHRDSIIWAPLQVMRHHTNGLLRKFLLSIVFPLLVLALHWNRARRDTALVLAWCSFLLGSFYAYMLAEKVLFTSGDFLWSAYITVFVLFVASALFWLRQLVGRPLRRWFSWRELLCCGALALHAICGAMMDWVILKHYGYV